MKRDSIIGCSVCEWEVAMNLKLGSQAVILALTIPNLKCTVGNLGVTIGDYNPLPPSLPPRNI